MYEGTVVKSTGSWYQVKGSDGQLYQCRLAGKIKLDELKLTNPVAVGDIVSFDLEDVEGVGNIRSIHPRKNYIVRQSPRKKHLLHFMASNVDQVFLVLTIREPNLKLGFIDRFLMMTEPYNIPVTLVFTKSDIYQDKDFKLLDEVKRVYAQMGYDIVLFSSVTLEGMETLKRALSGKTTLISGQSGVGKSTLINTIQPGLGLRTEDISEFSGKGQHTTTFAEMFYLDDGGSIIDTPGIKTLGFSHLEIMDVAHNFKEIFAHSAGCKFADCTHRNEPKCAVKEAVADGRIAEFRYQNYLAIIDEIENQNYWEIHDDV